MNYENYIVHIFVQKKDIDLNNPLNTFANSKVSGTGFYIDKGLILTCYHVVQNNLKIQVTVNKNSENIKVNANIKYIFPDDDLAIIELEDKETDYKVFDFYIIQEEKALNLEVNTVSPLNLEVNTVGFPLNSSSIKINKGVISGFQDSNIQTDSELNPGNSGGPLLYKNKVIGINQSKMIGTASGTGYAIPIFRFYILYKLKHDKLKLINNKPSFLFRYQINKQNFNNFDYGIRISEIHEKSCLNKYDIKVDDLILKINGNIINNQGKIKFDFFPEKINFDDLRLWFTEGDIVEFTIYSNKDKKIYNKNIEIYYIETNLLQYYSELNKKYIFENNGLVFSIFTNYHIEQLNELNMSLNKKVKILSRFITLNNKFTVYLSDLIFTKLKYIEYPINEIITHINDIEIIDYDTFISVMKTPTTKFKTIDNDIYFVISN